MTVAEQVVSLRRTLYRLLVRRVGARTPRPFMQLHALKAIARGEGCTQAALAERLLVDAPAVSRLVERLVADGLLRRTPGEDRRCVRLEVTEAGQAELAPLYADMEWLDGEVRRHLTEEEAQQLARLAEKLREGLSRKLLREVA